MFKFNFGIILACFLSTSQAKAQMVITEYFNVDLDFNIDLKDKKTEQIVYAKGVLDVVWQANKRVFAITYDPRMTVIDDVMTPINAAFEDHIYTAKVLEQSRNRRKYGIISR